MPLNLLARLGIKIDSTDVKKSKKDLDKLADSGGRAEKGFKLLKSAAVAAGAALVAREFAQAADTYTNLSNVLRQATTDLEGFKQAQDDVARIARVSHSDLTSIAQLYGKIGRASEELGINQTEVARTTETITKAIKLSGASTAEASSAITQLAQGLASGVLRGEEFNAVSESAPRLLEILKTELNSTTGELRALAAQGKLTAQVVIDSIKNQASAIDEEYSNLVPTIRDGLTDAGNGFIVFAGAINEATGAGEALSKIFSTIGDGLSAAAGAISEQRVALTELESLEVLYLELQRDLTSEQERLNFLRENGNELNAVAIASSQAFVTQLEKELESVRLQREAQQELDDLAELRGRRKVQVFDTRDAEEALRIQTEALVEFYAIGIDQNETHLQVKLSMEFAFIESLKQAYINYGMDRLEGLQFEEDETQAHLTRMASFYQEHLDARSESSAAAAEKIVEDQAIEEKNKAAIHKAGSAIFTSLMESESKQLFELGKVGRIGMAVMDAYGAINATLAQGGAFAIPAALAIGVAAFANVASIANRKFGDKSSGGTSSIPSVSPVQQQNNTTTNEQSISFNFTGASFGEGGGQDAVEQIQDFFDRDGRFRLPEGNQ